MSNCFLLFCGVNRKKVVDSNPCMTSAEITAVLGKMWNELPIEKKEHYKILSNKKKPKEEAEQNKRKQKTRQKQFQFTFKLDRGNTFETLNSAKAIKPQPIPQDSCVLPRMRLLDEESFNNQENQGNLLMPIFFS